MKNFICLNRTRIPVKTSLRAIALIALLFVFCGIKAAAQDTTPTPVPPPTALPAASPTPVSRPVGPQPFIKELRGISVGMSRKEVEDKLGSAKVADKAGLYYEFSRNNSAQIGFDADSTVRTVALIYMNGDKDAPSFAEIFGPDVASDAKPNGDIYKMIRYPEAGFWISYSLTNAEKQRTTVVTMRRFLH